MSERYLRNPRTAWRDYEGTTLVITPDDRKMHKLNGTAGFIWNAIGEKGATLDGLVRRMTEEFDAPERTIRNDAENFLKELLEKGVLVRE